MPLRLLQGKQPAKKRLQYNRVYRAAIKQGYSVGVAHQFAKDFSRGPLRAHFSDAVPFSTIGQMWQRDSRGYIISKLRKRRNTLRNKQKRIETRIKRIRGKP